MEELTELLAAWRKIRAPQLADAIDVVSRRVAGKRLPKSGNQDIKQGRWRDRLTSGGEDLEPLLDVFTDVGGDLVLERLMLLDGRDDPRISRKLTELLEKPPFVNLTTLSVWAIAFRMLEELRDVRCLPALAACDDSWLQKFRPQARAPMKALLDDARPRIEAACAVDVELPPEEIERLTKAYDLGSADDEARMLDAITAALDDDEPRLVYADWLLERGDPRGELIALMLAGQKPKRIQTLIETHGAEWLGPLTNAVRKVKWRRGFPCAGELWAKRGADAAKAIGDPRWRTFEKLTEGHSGINMLPILTDPALQNLERVEWLEAKNARHLLQTPRALPLKTLGLRWDAGPVKRLTKTIVDSKAIPALTHVAVRPVFEVEPVMTWYQALVKRMGRPLLLDLELEDGRVYITPEPKIVEVVWVTAPISERSGRPSVHRLTRFGLTLPTTAPNAK